MDLNPSVIQNIVVPSSVTKDLLLYACWADRREANMGEICPC